MFVSKLSSESRFDAVFGSARGVSIEADLLRGADEGDSELKRLCALVDADEFAETEALLVALSFEIAEELPRPPADINNNARAFNQFYVHAYALAQRIRLQPRTRVERLLNHYQRHTHAPLPATEIAVAALSHFQAIPNYVSATTVDARLDAAALDLELRANLYRILADRKIDRVPAFTIPAAGVFGAIMAEWLVNAGPEQVLPLALGHGSYRELDESFNGLNGRTTAYWLSPEIMSFPTWESFCSDCLYGADGRSDWREHAHQMLMEALLTMPDCIHG